LRGDQVSLETSTLILPLPKGGKTRHVPLSDIAKQILRSRDSFLCSPWVFPRKIDPKKAESAQYFVKAVYTTALHRVGITDACCHTLRHTAASRRVMAGVDLYTVKKILGHRDTSTTERYAHLAPGFLQEAVNRGSLSGTVTSDEGATKRQKDKKSEYIEEI